MTTGIYQKLNNIDNDCDDNLGKNILIIFYDMIGKSIESFIQNLSDDKFKTILNSKLLTKEFKNTIPQELVQTNYVTEFS